MQFAMRQMSAWVTAAGILLFALEAEARTSALEAMPSYFWRLFGLALALALGLGVLAWLLFREHKAVKAMADRLEKEVAERRRTEKRLELFHLAVEHSPASIVITNTDGVIEYVNQEFCKVTGYSPQEAVGNNPRLLKAEGLDQGHYEEMWQRIKQGKTWRGEFVNRNKHGDIFWETASISPVLESDGSATHYVAVKKDITHRKRMEEELTRRTEVLQATLDNMLHGIVMVDKDDRILAHNRRLQELFGFPPDFFNKPRTFEDIVELWCRVTGMGDAVVEKALNYAYRGMPASFELELPDGRTVEVLHNPLPGGGFVRTATDITSRKQAEALREDMERIARHDLKTPLNGVIGLPQLMLMDDNLTAEQREMLQQIRDVGYRMLRSVNLSLDLYKMETGSYELVPGPVDLKRLLRQVLRDAGLPRERDNVGVLMLCEGCETLEDTPCYAWGEELLCYNLFANLVANAAEAAPHGSDVRIEILRGEQEVAVSIHNKGLVPERIRDRFFDKYVTQGKDKGTGLGTYSARLFARVQHGDVAMRSSAEEGTTLTVHLPAKPDA